MTRSEDFISLKYKYLVWKFFEILCYGKGQNWFIRHSPRESRVHSGKICLKCKFCTCTFEHLHSKWQPFKIQITLLLKILPCSLTFLNEILLIHTDTTNQFPKFLCLHIMDTRLRTKAFREFRLKFSIDWDWIECSKSNFLSLKRVLAVRLESTEIFNRMVL